MEESKVRQFFGRMGNISIPPTPERSWLTAVSFLVGMLCSRGLVFGKYSPFGVAVAASVPKGGLWGAVLGSVYRLLNPFSGLCTGSICSGAGCGGGYSLVPSELKNVNTHPLYAPVVTSSAAAAHWDDDGIPQRFHHLFCCALCGGILFGSRVRLLFEPHFQSAGFPAVRMGLFETADVAALTVTAGIVVLAFSDVTISGVSIGRILMILMVIYCARVGDWRRIGCRRDSGGDSGALNSGAFLPFRGLWPGRFDGRGICPYGKKWQLRLHLSSLTVWLPCRRAESLKYLPARLKWRQPPSSTCFYRKAAASPKCSA